MIRAHAFVKNLGAAARQRIDPGFLELPQRVFDWELRSPSQIADLDHRKRLQMDRRVALLQPPDHLAEPVKAQFRVQSADDMEFGNRLAITFARHVPDLVERHGVGLLGRAFACRRRTACRPPRRHRSG